MNGRDLMLLIPFSFSSPTSPSLLRRCKCRSEKRKLHRPAMAHRSPPEHDVSDYFSPHRVHIPHPHPYRVVSTRVLRLKTRIRVSQQSGNATNFWSRIWIGDQSLQVSFHRLFLISTQKNSLVSEVFDATRGTWNLQFRRNLRIWELELLESLMQLLRTVTIDISREDCLTWPWSSNLLFSVNSVYSEWESQSFQENSNLLNIWKNLCPARIEIFAWLALQNKIASRSTLSRCNIVTLSQDLCPFCSLPGESPNHLLLLCPYAWNIWSAILKWWRIVWVSPSSLGSLSQIWFAAPFKNLEMKCWDCYFFSIIWSIWKSRNELIFNNKVICWEETAELVKIRVAIWTKGLNNLHSYSVEDFLGNLDAIRRIRI